MKKPKNLTLPQPKRQSSVPLQKGHLDAVQRSLNHKITSLELIHKSEFKELRASIAASDRKNQLNHNKTTANILIFKKTVKHRSRRTDRTLSKMSKKFNKIDRNFQKVEKRFKQIDRRFKQVDQRFAQVDRRFDQIDKRFEQIDKRFDQMDRRFEQVDRRFEQMENRFDQIDRRFEQIDQRFHNLEQKIDHKFAEIDARFEKIETRLDNIETSIQTLRLEMKAMYEYFDAKFNKMFAIVEEQNDRNKVVLDSYGIAYDKLENHQTRIEKMEVRLWGIKQS